MDYRKILIINPYGIGDVLFTTPVIRNLRLAFPKAAIGYLANARTASFLKADGDITRVFVYERDEFVQAYRQNPLKFARKWFELFQTIKQEAFDLALDFSMNSTFGFLTAACGIKERVGFDYKKRGRFLTDRLPFEGYQGKHVIEHQLDLLRYLQIPVATNRMSLAIPYGDIQWARQWVLQQGIDSSKPLIGVVPGAGASWGKNAGFRRWAGSKYAELLDKIIENFDAAVILMGDSTEQELCRDLAVQVHFPLYSATGQTTLTRMAALMARCRLVLVNDGGPLHVAVASGVKTVSIFGPQDHLIYGPYPAQGHVVVRKELPCQPCYRRFRMARCEHINCLKELSVEEVYRKVADIL
ncbi:MAG: glycosyltransferase family 9 protein [Candidatus Omnitrophica bacterium]|nr:glycosyltransferase family 9 protein [Candidatus Omnitrophota bacterium]